MTQEAYNFFFATLGLALAVFVCLLALLLIVDRHDKLQVMRHVRPLAIEFAALAAIGSMIGSLMLSEVVGYVPCRFCWYQRAFMYPAAIVLLVQLVGRNSFLAELRRPYLLYTAAALALGGLPISIYHRYVQARGTTGSCDPNNPCSTKYIRDEYGFITVPVIAGIAFVAIVFFIAVHIADSRKNTAKQK